MTAATSSVCESSAGGSAVTVTVGLGGEGVAEVGPGEQVNR